jgi:hypothetical protein
MIPAEEVRAKIDLAFNDIVQAAVAWQPTRSTDGGAGRPVYPAQRLKFKGTYADLNSMFVSKNWSLVLPIIPPTPERVKEMLKGTKRAPDEVLWVVPPREGNLTVELVAVLGVMAGAKPEHMPLLIATVEAFADPMASWRGPATTTAYTTPVIILSGPMINKLGLNPGIGTAGPQNPASNALAYFITLVGEVVGGAAQPALDKSTHGGSGDFMAMVFTENDKENPWGQSYAVEQGFKPEDSVVTVFYSYLGGANVDHDSPTGAALLNTIALTVIGNSAGIVSCLTDYDIQVGKTNNGLYTFVFLCPEHAQQIQRDFPTKDAVKKYLIKKAALPFDMYNAARCAAPEGTLPETLLQRFVKPESIKLVVTGGPGKQSQAWSPFPQVRRPVSRKLDM